MFIRDASGVKGNNKVGFGHFSGLYFWIYKQRVALTNGSPVCEKGWLWFTPVVCK